MQVKVNEKIGTCGCGRSPTGNCIGWHSLTEEDFQQRLKEWQDNENNSLMEEPK